MPEIVLWSNIERLNIIFMAEPIKKVDGYYIGDVFIPTAILDQHARSGFYGLRFRPGGTIRPDLEISGDGEWCVVIEWPGDGICSIPVEAIQRIDIGQSIIPQMIEAMV
jgi:hypothetical protein